MPPVESAPSAAVEAGPSIMGDANTDSAIEAAFDVPYTVQIILNGGYKTVSADVRER
jgi:hypothetical protein